MNKVVSAASLATATAVVAPPMVPANSVGLSSFPDLVDRFSRIRALKVAQLERDKTWSDKIEDLVENKISAENPDPDADPVNGSSMAWNWINPELTSVAEAILRKKPRSLVDLAWQTEALLTADDELLEANREHPLLPRLLRNIRTLAGPLQVPGEGAGISATDAPIDAGLLELGVQFDRASSKLNEAFARAADLYEPIHAAIEAQSTWPEDQEKWSRGDAKNYHETTTRVLAEIGAEWNAAIMEAEEGWTSWNVDGLTRAIWAAPAQGVAGLGVKARASAFASKLYWDKPFNELDWDIKAARSLIEATLDAAGLERPEYMGNESEAELVA